MERARAVHIRVATAGSHFWRMASRHDTLRVVARMGDILHVTAGDGYGCIGATRLPDGPLNAVVEPGSLARFHPLDVGDRICVDLPACGASRASEVPARAPAGDQRAALEAVRCMASILAPPDGLLRAALDLGPRDGAIERVALPHLDRLKDWLARRGCATDSPAPPVGLLGLGPGLTPSGDDVLCGTLIALHTCGCRHAADELGAAVLAAAPEATTRFSRAALAAAAVGEAVAPLHSVIDALVSGEGRGLAPRVESLGRLGHSSGWDALAGAMLAIEAELDRQTPPDVVS